MRYLSAAELPVLIAALNSHDQRQGANIFRWFLLTGARRGESLSAKWSEIDFDRGIWTKPSVATNQRKEHCVPLSEPALALLCDIHNDPPTRPHFSDDPLRAPTAKAVSVRR